MPRPFATNSNYQAVIRALLQIHRLWVDGKGESPEADAIRDAMDGPWSRLSDSERERVRGLSEDLNSINDPALSDEDVLAMLLEMNLQRASSS